jgi:hypothetical protein
MASNKPLTDIFEAAQYDLESSWMKGKAWFEQERRKLIRQRHLTQPRRILRGDPTNLQPKVYPGKLFMFMYDPKTKEDLPYYDIFPMVLPWKRVPGGFMGLNLHYIPLKERFMLMNRLMMFKTNQKMDETTRIRYSYEMINGVAKFAYAKPCIKHYLYEHVKSQFRLIPASDWGTAMMVPAEHFRKAPIEKVWADSRKIARK